MGSSSNDHVGSSTENNPFQASEPELLNFDYAENEEEDYYCIVMKNAMMRRCYDDEEADFEFDETDFNQKLADKFDDLDLPPGVEATVPWLQKPAADGPGTFKSVAEIDDVINMRYEFFKQFDTVEDFSDHHFANKPIGKTGKEWTKRIQHDWKLLEKDLPASIYVRVSENRMDLLRAVMIGPQGTPYHDGLSSLMLNLLLLILLLLLQSGTQPIQLCYRTMLYSLRRPPQHFEALVAGHFRERGRAILCACKHYMKGHNIGSVVPVKDEDGKQGDTDDAVESSSSSGVKPQLNNMDLSTGHDTYLKSFKTNMKFLFEELLMEFNVKVLTPKVVR
ncbi:hypothetical protein GUJ93_ZPchr0149g29151 [Zizania palustris]|uniref:UBC core domain-containing protein n=1 Tax=Zizania palustris TaxID=103762 RepID=A0A8J5V3A2_ZIZPA|nr:hypothetical protein GUJ93_ZPchr0149g29151 [Zizania palustris]